MRMAAGFVLIVMAQAAWAAPGDQSGALLAASKVETCGLGTPTVRYDDLLQTDVLVMADLTTASDAQLRCIDETAGAYDVDLPTALQSRFDAVRKARVSIGLKGTARDWLTRKGLIDQVPTYRTGITDDAAFAREIEGLCGPSAQGAFQSSHGPHTLSPEWMRGLRQPNIERYDALSCIMYVAWYSDYKFGFLGNEEQRR